MISFYVHIPYCIKRCGYCDFNTYTPSELQDGATLEIVSGDYIDAVLKELEFAPAEQVPTIFFGGGTPSLLPAKDLGRVISAIREHNGLVHDAEITLEANPDSVTPEKLAALTDDELRACYFTRQKIVYARGLTEAIQSKQIKLRALHHQPDESVREQLINLKGIGNWTIDVYLMHALRRTDLFPLGDIALVNSLKHIKQLPDDISKEDMLEIAAQWRPNRTIAAMILWHDYMQRRKVTVKD